MGYFVKNRQLQSGSTGTVVGTGPTSERLTQPKTGYLRYNTSTVALEYYDGVDYQTVASASAVHYSVDNFTGNGGATKFTMSTNVVSASQVLVFVNGLYQSPGRGIYSVNGTTTITFNVAPVLGAVIAIIHSTA